MRWFWKLLGWQYYQLPGGHILWLRGMTYEQLEEHYPEQIQTLMNSDCPTTMSIDHWWI